MLNQLNKCENMSFTAKKKYNLSPYFLIKRKDGFLQENHNPFPSLISFLLSFFDSSSSKGKYQFQLSL